MEDNIVDQVYTIYRWFQNLMILTFLAVLFLAVMVILLPHFSYTDTVTWFSNPLNMTPAQENFCVTICIIAIVILIVVLTVAQVLAWILLYRSWQSIQDGKARTSPGKAVGYCLIPVFQYFWLFIAFYGLSKDMNRYLRDNNVDVPPVKEGVALLFCVWPYIFFPVFLFFRLQLGSKMYTDSQHDIILTAFVVVFILLMLISIVLHWILIASFARNAISIFKLRNQRQTRIAIP